MQAYDIAVVGYDFCAYVFLLNFDWLRKHLVSPVLCIMVTCTQFHTSDKHMPKNSKEITIEKTVDTKMCQDFQRYLTGGQNFRYLFESESNTLNVWVYYGQTSNAA